MINPEILEAEAEGIFTSVPDHAQDSESVMVYPDLLKFLKQKQWKLMSGHSPTSRYTDDFRSRLTTDAHFVRCKVDTTKNFVKLILFEPIETHIMMVKVPNLEEKIKNKISAENLEETLEGRVFCTTMGHEIKKPSQMVKNETRFGLLILPRGIQPDDQQVKNMQTKFQQVHFQDNTFQKAETLTEPYFRNGNPYKIKPKVVDKKV